MLKHFSFRVSSLSYNPWLAKHTDLNNERKQLERARRWHFEAVYYNYVHFNQNYETKMAVHSCLLKMRPKYKLKNLFTPF